MQEHVDLGKYVVLLPIVVAGPLSSKAGKCVWGFVRGYLVKLLADAPDSQP
jgi:hypothetical protein